MSHVLSASYNAPFRHQAFTGSGGRKKTGGKLGGRAPFFHLQRRDEGTAKRRIEQDHVNAAVGHAALVEMLFGEREFQS